jgi:hypothetical protein
MTIGFILPYEIAKMAPCQPSSLERFSRVTPWIVGSIAKLPRLREDILTDLADHGNFANRAGSRNEHRITTLLNRDIHLDSG